MNIIDGRAFVPFREMSETNFFTDIPKRTQVAQEKYNTHLSKSCIERSMSLFIEEMEQAKITRAVVPARLATESVSNDTVSELLASYPERFIGMAHVECSGKHIEDTIKEYVLNGLCTGVVIEPGCEKEKFVINDERIYRIYDLCQTYHIPIMVGFGGMLYPNMAMYKPDYLDQVLQDFPDLNLCVMHGGWPYVGEMCWMALMHKNFYIMPDIYLCETALSNEYVKAANTLIKSKIIFASCYPVISLKTAIDHHLNGGFNEDVLPKVMAGNVEAFLGL